MNASSSQSQGTPVPLHPEARHPVHRVPALPFPRNTFVGRETETSALRALLTHPDVPLVTITGPGGAGKTRLALHVAHTLKEIFTGGIAYVPLAPIRNPSLVENTIADQVGATATSTHSLWENLLHFLQNRRFLLILDNVEHLLSASPLIAELLQQAPDLTILTTSRIRLGLTGEHLYPVHPLHSDAAIHLFHLRAQAIDPSFTLTPHTQPVIRQICDRIDRLPLAIELAASRTLIFTPQALLNQLDSLLPTLTGGPLDAPPRSQDLRATIAWSYDLLQPATQRLFRQLGIFVGGFTLQAAQAVSGSPDDVLPLIFDLVDSSLLISIKSPDEEPRFTMLETIREFTLHHLTACGEEAVTAQKHAMWFREFAESLAPLFDTRHLSRAICTFEADLDNCRAALTWNLANHRAEESLRLAGALWLHIRYGPVIREHARTARFEEGRWWLEQALPLRHDAPVAAIIDAIGGIVFTKVARHDLDSARDYATELLFRSEAENHALGRFRSHKMLGEIALWTDNLEEAVSHIDPLAAIAPTLPNPDSNLAITFWLQAGLHSLSEEFDQALDLLHLALEHAKRSGSPFLTGNILDELTFTHREAGTLDNACEWLQQAMQLYDPQWNTCLVLNELVQAAQIAQAAKLPTIVARFLAAVDSLTKPFDPAEDTEPALHYAKSHLDSATFESAWHTGKSLQWHEILEEIAALNACLHNHRGITDPPFGLSPRERDVLRLVTAGRSNRDIAGILSLSVRTVENHMLHILTKLKLESRTAAAAFAIRHQLD